MAYSTNPNLPKARAIAMQLLMRDQLPLYAVANRCGVHRSTVWRWKRKWDMLNAHVQFDNPNRPNRIYGCTNHLIRCSWRIPTLSSRPHHSPRAINEKMVARVLELRRTLRRCAEVIWHHLQHVDGIRISLSSVRRILRRHHAYDRPKHARRPYRRTIPRPAVVAPGDLVQVDTVHMPDPFDGSRKYIVTAIDLCIRIAYASVSDQLNQHVAIQTVLKAKRYFTSFGFSPAVIQADNGPEFGRSFKEQVERRGISLRHSRPHRPNDNAHIERFNRTLREECIGRYLPSTRTLRSIQTKLNAYLDYYNCERVHLSLQCKTPADVASEMLQRL